MHTENPTSQAGERTLSFDVSKFEHELCNAIADRAVEFAKRHDFEYKKSTALMDITATHASGCPLRLDALLNADSANFAHDVFGIRRHLNRSTGQLEDCFVPRFAL